VPRRNGSCWLLTTSRQLLIKIQVAIENSWFWRPQEVWGCQQVASWLPPSNGAIVVYLGVENLENWRLHVRKDCSSFGKTS